MSGTAGFIVADNVIGKPAISPGTPEGPVCENVNVVVVIAAVTVSVCAPLVPPPGVGLVTLTDTLPTEAIAEAATVVVNDVELT